MEKKRAGAAVAQPDLDALLQRASGSKPPEPEPAGECVVCRGQLVADETREFDATRGSLVIGPGGKNQYRTVHHGWYCERCGLKYKHLPSRPVEHH